MTSKCIFEIFKIPYAYVGMMGSKGGSAMVRKDLKEHGIEIEKINELHSPIGLSICAATPQEIALSVMSEIVYCKINIAITAPLTIILLMNLQNSLMSREDFMYHYKKKRQCSKKCRNADDSNFGQPGIIGTIGGGCAEAEIITRCRDIFNGFVNANAGNSIKK